MSKKTEKPTLDAGEYFDRKARLIDNTMSLQEGQHENMKLLVGTVNRPRTEGQAEIRLTEPLNIESYIKNHKPESVHCLIDGRPVTPEMLAEFAKPGDLFRVIIDEDFAKLELIKRMGCCVYALVGNPMELADTLAEQLKAKEVHFYHGNQEISSTVMCMHVRSEDSYMVEAFGGRINITLLNGEKKPKVFRVDGSDFLVIMRSLWVEHLKRVEVKNPLTGLKKRSLTTECRSGRLLGNSSRYSIYGPHIEFSTRIVEGFMTEERTDQLRELAEDLECYVGNTKCDLEEFLHILDVDDVLLLQIFTSSARLVINQAVGVFQHPVKDITEETKKMTLRRASSMLTNSTFGAFGTPYTLTTPKTYLGPKAVSAQGFINYLDKGDVLVSHSLGVSSAISCTRADEEDYSESKLLVNCDIYPTSEDGVYTDLLKNDFIRDILDGLVHHDVILPNWEDRANHNILKRSSPFTDYKLSDPVYGLDTKHARARAEAEAKQPRRELSPLMARMLKRL
ncbi:hypothetical protein [Vibrio phage phiKT1019]|nr:hypothetical protein [Vibrio phage phiKT1019]